MKIAICDDEKIFCEEARILTEKILDKCDMPDMEQWWITGFVPNPMDYSVTPDELYAIASVDFSENPLMFSAIERKIEEMSAKNDTANNKIILDKNLQTIWIVW